MFSSQVCRFDSSNKRIVVIFSTLCLGEKVLPWRVARVVVPTSGLLIEEVRLILPLTPNLKFSGLRVLQSVRDNTYPPSLLYFYSFSSCLKYGIKILADRELLVQCYVQLLEHTIRSSTGHSICLGASRDLLRGRRAICRSSVVGILSLMAALPVLCMVDWVENGHPYFMTASQHEHRLKFFLQH